MRRYIFNIIICVLGVATSFGQTAHWRFAVVGDTHVPRARTICRIVPRLLADSVEVVLFAGDLIHGGKGEDSDGMREELLEWKSMVKPLEDAGIKVIAIRGNHEDDVRGDNLTPWYELISPALNVIYRHRNITFIGIDNYMPIPHTVNTAWLSEALRSAQTSLIVPFGHEAAFSCYTFHPDCLDAEPYTRDEFWRLLGQYGVKYYFCGHSHQYNKGIITDRNGNHIYQIVTGGGGGFLQPQRGQEEHTADYTVKELEFESITGYLLADVDNDEITPRWIAVYDATAMQQPQRRSMPTNRARHAE